jgi:hypothetical protein
MGDFGPFGPAEWDEFLRDFAQFRVKLEGITTHYVIDMPRDDIECRVLPGFDSVNNTRVTDVAQVRIEKKDDGEVLHQDDFQIRESAWEDQFRCKILHVMKNWRDLVI